MKKTSLSKRQDLFAIIGTLPFVTAAIFLIIGLFSLDDIYLDSHFSIDIITVITFCFIHLSIILVLKRINKIDINFPKSKLKKLVSVFAYLIILVLSNFLLVMGLKMNLNYWLKGNTVSKIELIVTDKNISHGKSTDYYIIFNSKNGKLKNKVRSKNFDSFSIGETFQASVNEGFFQGYFLTEPLKTN
ncbi:hypothetical protein SAMN05660845_0901 [Flavobacterium swingsii]|uniref:Uncharacterized protein n=1 Tax=Flavobacterium swingsii TaxID=498292 RepID=A0A1I0WRB1_9FLAO|nr:hypothetical protein [Flavobacterium swingsii]SFA90526.1 hypothetical protein SAMN05660845_0901 [Flavobacterium swingsii]